MDDHVPKSVREKLRLEDGDAVAFVEDDEGRMVVKRVPGHSVFTKWRGYLKDLRGKDVDQLVSEMRGHEPGDV